MEEMKDQFIRESGNVTEAEIVESSCDEDPLDNEDLTFQLPEKI